jgi:hypothetical protein
MLAAAAAATAALQTEKLIDGRWQVVPPADRMKITQLDGQVGCRGSLLQVTEPSKACRKPSCACLLQHQVLQHMQLKRVYVCVCL